MLPKRPIRIATLGDWGRYFSYFLAGSQEGSILNGCLFRPIDIRQKDTIWSNIVEFRPDILLSHCIFGTEFDPPQIHNFLEKAKRRIGTRVFYHAGDARTMPRCPKPINRFIDGCLVNQTGNLKKFSELWQVPTYHWPYGCFAQKSIAKPNPHFVHDLVFTGRLSSNHKGVHGPRTIFIEQIKSKIPIRIFPDEEYTDTKLLTAEIAASAKAILGVCAGYNILGYMDVRPFQYPGAGAFLLQRKYSNMELVFENNKHMVWFNHDNSNEFINLYKQWLTKPKEIQRIREEGFKFCQKHHSMKRRMEDVINIVYNGLTKTKIFLNDL
tara:strand:+ start:5034 stop:6008 length:975 start_codon:yes stop_codon:yes gene_type:complete